MDSFLYKTLIDAIKTSPNAFAMFDSTKNSRHIAVTTLQREQVFLRYFDQRIIWKKIEAAIIISK